MLQLTIELIDSAIEVAFIKRGVPLTQFEVFQPAWILVMSMIWVSLKQTISLFTPNSGRVIGLIHAISMVLTGVPVLFLLTQDAFGYHSMFDSLKTNYLQIAITCNVMCYTSVGYFLMDSYFLVHKAYLKHHVGAIVAWLIAANHHETSLVHGAVVIALFEIGAILVQLSRMFAKTLWFRFFVCLGYTGTRVSLTWYYGFIFYTCYQLFTSCSTFIQFSYIPVFAALLFLLALNAKWTMLQWRAFIKALSDSNSLDFYTYHQQIIGNTSTTKSA